MILNVQFKRMAEDCTRELLLLPQLGGSSGGICPIVYSVIRPKEMYGEPVFIMSGTIQSELSADDMSTVKKITVKSR